MEKGTGKRALFFANGEVTKHEMQLVDGEEFDVVIAADGGAVSAEKWGWIPDFVVGDLDSISADLKRRLKETRFVYRPDQDSNDLEKTLRFCEEQKITAITLFGISGRRLDHTLNNLSVLARFDRKFEFTILDPYARIYFIRDEFRVEGQPGQTISLIPLGKAEGVVTTGLEFPLQGEDLLFGTREGLSNVMTGHTAQVRIKKGLLLAFVNRPGEND